jgi:aspartyl-tRNA(Asn)/glutamyl-tRNA(Gln) amidotransferase subunit A
MRTISMAVRQTTEPVWGPFPTVGATATVQACLERIRALNPEVNAMVSVDEEGALDRARECDEAQSHGQQLGLLHGMPVVVKDNIDVAGLVTSSGSPAAGRRPDSDAPVAARLRAAGAIILGKANLDEFALGAMGINAHFGRCRNPWDVDRVPGGSSGGSAAAVAAAMSIGALGTDTSGSVRTPAALTGLVGLRPSPGRTSLDGITPVSPFFDTVGPMARNAADVLRIFLAIAGDEWGQPAEAVDLSSAMRDLSGLRVGLLRKFFLEECHPHVAERVEAAVAVLHDRGATLVDVTLPDPRPAHEQTSQMMLADAYQFHRSRLDSEPETYGPEVRRRILGGQHITGATYSAARSWGARWSRHVRAAFATVDVMVTPTVPRPAPRLEDFGNTLEGTAEMTRYTYAWTLAGVPAISIPCGFVDGLPVGMQVVADHNREDLLFRVAMDYQRATPWHRQWPDMLRPDASRRKDPS